MIFEVLSLQKSTQNRCQNEIEESIAKKAPKIDFGVHFGLPKPSKTIPKTTRGTKKWGLEQSLFRDAMQIARASAEINGSHRL